MLLIHKILIDLAKNRVYLTGGKQAPKGRTVIHTKQGKSYYIPKKREHKRPVLDIRTMGDFSASIYNKMDDMSDEMIFEYIDEIVKQYRALKKELEEWRSKYKEWDPEDNKDFLQWEHHKEIQDRVIISNHCDTSLNDLLYEAHKRMVTKYLKENPDLLNLSKPWDICGWDKSTYSACDNPEYKDFREEYGDRDELHNLEKVAEIIAEGYTYDMKYDEGSYAINEKRYYNSYKKLDKKLLNEKCKKVSRNIKTIDNIIDEFRQVRQTLDIPMPRAHTFTDITYNLFSSGLSTTVAAMATGIMYTNPLLITRDPDLPVPKKSNDGKVFNTSYLADNHTDYIKYVIWHELGHQVVRYFGGLGGVAEGDTDARREIRIEQQLLPPSMLLNRLFKSVGMDAPQFNTVAEEDRRLYPEGWGKELLHQMAPSEYAKKDPNELFAESFAVHRMGGDDLLHPKFKELFKRLGI
jgi:hypothetical protein